MHQSIATLRGQPVFERDICDSIPDDQKGYYGCPVIVRETVAEEPPVRVKTHLNKDAKTLQKKTPIVSNPRLKIEQISVMLDLDETLIHTFYPKGTRKDGSKDHITQEQRNSEDYYFIKLDDGNIMEGVKRPHLDKFLQIVFDLTYPQFVFTAGNKPYADDIASIIFKNRRPTKIYHNADCHQFGQLKKPIRRAFKEFPDFMKDGRLLVVDDKIEVYYPNDHGSVFVITPWEGTNNNDTHLLEVGRLILELSSHSRSVTESQSFDKKFGKTIYNGY